MLESFKSVLVLAPHTDDGELGAGGTIAKLAEQGAEISYVAFSAAEESVPAGFERNVLRGEAAAATAILGINSSNFRVLDYRVRVFDSSRQLILEDLIKLRASVKPDLVLCPSRSDIHQDHHVVAMEALRAFKRATVLGYELVWNNLLFDGVASVPLSQRHVLAKIEALAAYKSQAGRDYMSADFVRSMAKVRGVQVGTEYAECFEVLRWLIN